MDTPWSALAGGYCVMSVLTFFVYGYDKHAARAGRQRTPEPALHLLSFLGGWPGALAARTLFRHKTRKQPFRVVFWLAVAANIGVLAWAITRGAVNLG